MLGKNRQTGMTMIGWILSFGLLAFLVLLALRLVPNYLEFYTISSALESLQNEPNITQKSTAEVRSLITRRFDINDVEHVTARDVQVRKADGRLLVSLEYEVRVPILANVDAVTYFSKEVEMIRN